MPDDVVVEEESQEQPAEETVDEGELAFDEVAEDKEAPDKPEKDKSSKKDEKPEKAEKKADAEKDTEKDKAKKADKEAGAEKKTDKKAEDDKKAEADKKADEKRTARERLEDRLKDESEETKETKEAKEKEAAAEKKTKAEAKEKETPAKIATKPVKLTKESVKTYLDFFSDDDFPDKEIVVGDRTINFKELKEDEPELYDAMKVMSGYTFDKAIRHMASTGAIVTGEQLKTITEQMQNLQDEVGDSRFWAEVAQTHSDVHQILTPKNKQFVEWRDKQPKNIQKLAKNLDTPQDAIDIIDAYKEDLAKEKTGDHDDNLARKKKEKDDLHKGTMKSSQTHKTSKDAKADEGEAAFNEPDKDD